MAARTPRRSFAAPFVVTLAAPLAACFVQSGPPPQQPNGNPPPPDVAQQQPQTPPPSDHVIVANPPRPTNTTDQQTQTTPPPDHGPIMNPPRPTPNVSQMPQKWTIFKQGGECAASEKAECPAGAMCNPPPPIKYACPENTKLPLVIQSTDNGQTCTAERDVQPAAPARLRLSEAVSSDGPSDRVREEWRARIAAEYTSAAITQSLVLWLIQAGAPPDLIDAGLVIVGDELVHSRMSHEVYVAAGGTAPPAIVREQLGLARTSQSLEHDILLSAVRVFCLGETVAVPLFKHLRQPCSQPLARAALDRILRDEVRHRDFGWDLLDWLLSTPFADRIPALLETHLPSMMKELEASYGIGNPSVAGDDGHMTEVDRTWGLAPPRDYAGILAQTVEKDYKPRFAARGLVMSM